MMNNLFQETVLNFIHDAYHNQNGNLFVPEHLRMSRDITNPRIAAKLKAYRTRNRYFVFFSIWHIFMTMLMIFVAANINKLFQYEGIL